MSLFEDKWRPPFPDELGALMEKVCSQFVSKNAGNPLTEFDRFYVAAQLEAPGSVKVVDTSEGDTFAWLSCKPLALEEGFFFEEFNGDGEDPTLAAYPVSEREYSMECAEI